MEEREKEQRIKAHELWMGFRRNYHKVKEGHTPEITHKEVEQLIWELIIRR